MNKKVIKEIKEATQLNYLEKDLALTGVYRGYNVSVGLLDKTHNISYINISMKLPEDFAIEKLNVFLNSIRSKYKALSVATYENYKIKLNYTPRFRKHNKSELMISLINEVLDFAQTNYFTNCCEFCGENNLIAPVMINGIIASTCVNCKLEVKNSISMNQQAEKRKSGTIIGGIVGSVLGALLGSLVWIIIYRLGYIAAIGGLAIAVCSIKGYELFGGKLNLTGIIITTIITILGVYVAQHISLGLDIYEVYKEMDVTFFECINAVPYFLEEEEIARSFWCNLGIGYLLTLLASVSYIRKAYKQSNCKIKVEDINL